MTIQSTLNTIVKCATRVLINTGSHNNSDCPDIYYEEYYDNPGEIMNQNGMRMEIYVTVMYGQRFHFAM